MVIRGPRLLPPYDFAIVEDYRVLRVWRVKAAHLFSSNYLQSTMTLVKITTRVQSNLDIRDPGAIPQLRKDRYAFRC